MFVYSSVIPEDEERQLISKPSKDLQSMLAGMFRGDLPRDMAKQVSRQVRRLAERSGMLPPEVANDVVKNLDFSAWTPLVPAAEKALATTSREASVRSLWKFGIDENEAEGRRTRRFAEKWAAVRAAELVGMKRVDGKLVVNPDAEFAITESTRDMVRSLVQTAVKQEWSAERLADEMTKINAFSPERAEKIAREELNMASNKGQMIAFKTSGIVIGSRWITRHDDKVEPECRRNEAAGIVELGSKYPSGHEHPTAHVGCRCKLAAVLGS